MPAARLFCRKVNASISKGIKSSRPIKVLQGLEEELKYWRYLDSWNGYLPWKDEKHFVVQIILGASNSGLGRGEGEFYTCRMDPRRRGTIGLLMRNFLFKTLLLRWSETKDRKIFLIVI